jgi:N6-L-threonylcarbamoyladenine synthase
MLGLDYPGGPLIDEFAKTGNENYHRFPVSSLKENIYDFSFSGIKTSLLYFLRKEFGGAAADTLPINDICASYQRAVVASLVEKTILASKKLGIKSIAVSGGVSANSKLRIEFMKYSNEGYLINFPQKIYSTDNAAMIGYTAYLKFKNSSSGSSGKDLLENAFARFEY